MTASEMSDIQGETSEPPRALNKKSHAAFTATLSNRAGDQSATQDSITETIKSPVVSTGLTMPTSAMNAEGSASRAGQEQQQAQVGSRLLIFLICVAMSDGALLIFVTFRITRLSDNSTLFPALKG